MTTMKKYIFTSIIALAAAVSCVEGPSDLNVQTEGNMLKVKFETPELEVKSGSETIDFYAYITSDLKAGTINPIGYSDISSDGYYLYNLPEGTDEVVFTNIGADNEDVTFTTDESGNLTFVLNDTYTFIDTEVLYGSISGFSAGVSQSVSIKRLSSALSTELYLTDSEGSLISTDEIEAYWVFYSGLGISLTMNEYGEFVPVSRDMSFGSGCSASLNTANEETDMFIPGDLEPEVQVSVRFTDGSEKEYRKSLGKVLDANRHYRVRLYLKQLNGTAEMTLETPTVEETYQSLYPTYTEFFNVTGNTVVGGFANDTITLDITTALPYDWTYEVIQGSEFFNFDFTDGQLTVTALSDNVNEIRSATILFTTEEGYSRTITVYQKNSLKHQIVMIPQHNYDHTNIYISGENISITVPGKSAPDVYEGILKDKRIYLNGLDRDAEVVIEGDIITSFRAVGEENPGLTDQFGYRYDSNSTELGYYFYNYSNHYNNFRFSNCTYLEELIIQGYDATIDVSGMPSLKRLHIQNNNTLTSVTLADEQPLEVIACYNCDALTGIDVSKTASTLKSLNLYDCDALTGAVILNCPQLKYFNANSCNGMGIINLTGCTGIETLSLYYTGCTLNLTDCSSLKELRLENVKLKKLVTTGVSSLENMVTNSMEISSLDLSGMTSLKTIGDISATTVNLSGCSALESIGYFAGLESLDISGCTSLKTANIEFNGSASNQTVNFTDTAIEELKFSHLNANLDFSPLTSVKKFYLEYCWDDITEMDFSGCSSLEDLYISFYRSSADYTLQELYLPYSLKKFNIRGAYHYPGPLNMSYMTSLEEFDIYGLSSLNEIYLTGCTSLKSINYDNPDNDYDYNSSYLDCCSVNYLNITDCTSLEYMNMYDCNISDLDFSTNPNIYNVDLRYNNMSAASINNMISSLPDRSMSAIQGKYQIDGNPGTDEHDESAANDKGWWR